MSPGVTQVRIAVTRIPESVRPRLRRLAQRGAEVCRKHGAGLLAEISTALELALGDMAASEGRATNAEGRARRAEQELADARVTIRALQVELATRAADEFEAPTLTKEAPALIERCRR